MTTIITANFQLKGQAKQAVSDLAGAGFTSAQTSTFFVNPLGQRDSYPIESDEDEAPESEGEGDRSDSDIGAGGAIGAAVGSAIGAAVGLASVPVLGPGGAVIAVGVGAYAGSLIGALGSTEEQQNLQADAIETDATDAKNSRIGQRRKSGMLVAVATPQAAQQDIAIHIFRALGATDIERPEGNIVAGEWTDFNAGLPLKLVAA